MAYGGQSWSSIAPGTEDRMARQRALDRLKNLEREENARLDYARQKGPNLSGINHSGYDNERRYREGLNRQGEMADIQSRLGGRGPAQVRHVGAVPRRESSEDGMRPSMAALRPRGGAMAEDDATNYQMERAQLAGMQADARRRQAAADTDDWADDPYRQRRQTSQAIEALRSTGAAKRDIGAEDAAQAARNEVTQYSLTEPIRRDQAFDARQAQRDADERAAGMSEATRAHELRKLEMAAETERQKAAGAGRSAALTGLARGIGPENTPPEVAGQTRDALTQALGPAGGGDDFDDGVTVTESELTELGIPPDQWQSFAASVGRRIVKG